MTIAEKQKQLCAVLGAFRSPQDRLAYIVGRGRAAARLEPALRTEAFRVEGCLANVWFVPRWEKESGRCQFHADSDSAVIKGIAVLLCEFYSGLPPAEIAKASPSFLAEFGLTQHLTPNRRNSLAKIWESIRNFAQAHLDK